MAHVEWHKPTYNVGEEPLVVEEEGAIQFANGKYIIRTEEEAIKQLKSQQMVAIFQNDSEIGPRALGNRSLMFDPTNPDAKNIVNEIKEREPYRPFAGSMLLEYFEDYFETESLKESPYMSYAITVKIDKVDEISSIVHHDYTCRIQTVTEEQNKNYYSLIKAWHKETECPVIFNTSFNLGGEAMVESLEDAIDTCKRSMINFIYLPEDQDQWEHMLPENGEWEEEQEEEPFNASKDSTTVDTAFINK